MKVIIAGSRDARLTMKQLVDAIQVSGFHITEVVSGHSGNVDLLGEKYAGMTGLPITFFPADWKVYGKRAGPVRNRQMANYADALIAIWDGKSRGTSNMIEEANHHELQTYILRYHNLGGTK